MLYWYCICTCLGYSLRESPPESDVHVDSVKITRAVRVQILVDQITGHLATYTIIYLPKSKAEEGHTSSPYIHCLTIEGIRSC